VNASKGMYVKFQISTVR